MTGRAALAVAGALLMAAAVALQLYRTTLEPMPVWAAPLLLALTWGCLLGGAFLLGRALTRNRTEGQHDQHPRR